MRYLFSQYLTHFINGFVQEITCGRRFYGFTYTNIRLYGYLYIRSSFQVYSFNYYIAESMVHEYE